MTPAEALLFLAERFPTLRKVCLYMHLSKIEGDMSIITHEEAGCPGWVVAEVQLEDLLQLAKTQDWDISIRICHQKNAVGVTIGPCIGSGDWRIATGGFIVETEAVVLRALVAAVKAQEEEV